MKHILDRPIWSALQTRHAPLTEDGGLARRYPSSIVPFAATEQDSDEALEALAALALPGERLVLLMADPIIVPTGFTSPIAAPAVQMISDELPAAMHDERIVQLGWDDAAEMLELAKLTEPGPFSLNALRLGNFWGIRINGRLAAMAGERMKQPGFTELSGVCTHPDFRGEGLARSLSLHVAHEIVKQGDRPYLHAYEANKGAVGLYESIGFKLRTSINVAVIEKEATAIS